MSSSTSAGVERPLQSPGKPGPGEGNPTPVRIFLSSVPVAASRT